MKIDPDAIFAPSEKVAARAIEDEFIIVPVMPEGSGRGAELYLLNETGRVIWEHLNGKTPLRQVVEKISEGYNTASIEEIRQDVWHLVEELLTRRIITQVTERSANGPEKTLGKTETGGAGHRAPQ